MNRWFWTLLGASTIAFGALNVGCGDDDVNGGAKDAGGDVDINNPDGGDGGGPCASFASYVINLINTQTTASAQPDTTLGAGCPDSTSQDEFKSLFP